MTRPVAITGRGVVTPLGVGRESQWEAVGTGQPAVGPLTRLTALGLDPARGGEVTAAALAPFLSRVPRKQQRVANRMTLLALVAAALAMEEAGLEAGAGDGDRLGVIMGVDALDWELADLLKCLAASQPSDGGLLDVARANVHMMRNVNPLDFSLKVLPNLVAGHLAIAWNARGACRALVEGSVGGAHAIVQAWRMIAEGELEVALCGGAHAPLTELAYMRAVILDRLARDNAAATMPSEGSGVLVLESMEHAQARGARIVASVAGAGIVAGAGVETIDEDPERLAARLARAIRTACPDGARPPGLVVLQGSAVQRDPTEMDALARAFEAGPPPTVSLADLHGDLGAARSPVDLIACSGALPHGIIPGLGAEAADRPFPSPEGLLLLVRGAFGECAALRIIPVDAH